MPWPPTWATRWPSTRSPAPPPPSWGPSTCSSTTRARSGALPLRELARHRVRGPRARAGGEPARAVPPDEGHRRARWRCAAAGSSSASPPTRRSSAYPGWGAYGVSKARSTTWCGSGRRSCASTGVRFLSVDPGEMDTRMHARRGARGRPADARRPGRRGGADRRPDRGRRARPERRAGRAPRSRARRERDDARRRGRATDPARDAPPARRPAPRDRSRDAASPSCAAPPRRATCWWSTTPRPCPLRSTGRSARRAGRGAPRWRAAERATRAGPRSSSAPATGARAPRTARRRRALWRRRIDLGAGLGARRAVVRVSTVSPRLVELRFDSRGRGALERALPRRPAGAVLVPRGPLALWHVQTAYAGRPWAAEMPSAGGRSTCRLLRALCGRRGVGSRRVTHAAGLFVHRRSRARRALPLPERFDLPEATVAAIEARAAPRAAASSPSAPRSCARSRARAAEDGRAAGRRRGVTNLRIGPGLRARGRRRAAHRHARAGRRATSSCSQRLRAASAAPGAARPRRGARATSATSSATRA